MARDPFRDSWRLKLARAEHHMHELETEVGRYADRHAYQPRRTNQDDPNPEYSLWHLHITEQPDLSIAMVLGDVLTNLRASLDHIAVALVGGRKNQFPLVADVGNFDRSPTPEREAKYNEGRKSFAKAVKGMHPGAAAIIEALQPYHVDHAAPSPPDLPHIHVLLTLNRLVQADKHQRLIPIASGLQHARSFVVQENRVLGPGWYRSFVNNGAPVAEIPFADFAGLKGKVKVYIHGTPRISVEGIEGAPHNDILFIARQAIRYLKLKLFPSLEPFIGREDLSQP